MILSSLEQNGVLITVLKVCWNNSIKSLWKGKWEIENGVSYHLRLFPFLRFSTHTASLLFLNIPGHRQQGWHLLFIMLLTKVHPSSLYSKVIYSMLLFWSKISLHPTCISCSSFKLSFYFRIYFSLISWYLIYSSIEGLPRLNIECMKAVNVVYLSSVRTQCLEKLQRRSIKA